MNAAVDILAAGVVVQSLAYAGAALIFGLAVRRQLRIAAPVKQPEAPKQDSAAEPAKTGPVPLEKVS